MRPVGDFVRDYAASGAVRLHMPGHKGRAFLGPEPLDITEIAGADYLYGADGVIARSEAMTARAFGSGATLYSTEGSSLCIKTMLGLMKKCRCGGRRMTVMAPRNVHKAFIDGCILLDIEVWWVYPEKPGRSVCSSEVGPEDLRREMARRGVPDCVYVTSPDYLGFMADIRAMSELCREKGAALLVDNAHGAYLRFLQPSLHPLSLGADMCCDSAHKTLPCLTGGAYLHLSEPAAREMGGRAKRIMSVFGSTSPSYLILQSLDLCGEYLSDSFPRDLERTVRRTELCRERLAGMGFELCGDEPCKLTVRVGENDGCRMADLLRERGVEPEYSDRDYLVLMPSVFTAERDFEALEKAMSALPRGSAQRPPAPELVPAVTRMSIREAALAESEELTVEKAVGRICACTVRGCQPAVPVCAPGEEITPEAAALLTYYGTRTVEVCK